MFWVTTHVPGHPAARSTRMNLPSDPEPCTATTNFDGQWPTPLSANYYVRLLRERGLECCSSGGEGVGFLGGERGEGRANDDIGHCLSRFHGRS